MEKMLPSSETSNIGRRAFCCASVCPYPAGYGYRGTLRRFGCTPCSSVGPSLRRTYVSMMRVSGLGGRGDLQVVIASAYDDPMV